MSDVNVQNNAGYTAVMLASLTAPDGPAGMEVIRKLMELGNVNIRSSQVTLHNQSVVKKNKQSCYVKTFFLFCESLKFEEF